MKKILLDTNTVSNLFKGNQIILNQIINADKVFISVIVLGELYAGFRGGTKEDENRLLLDNFLNKSTIEIIKVSQETAEIFGDLKSGLKKKGTPIPLNDVWIAAHTIETGCTLITNDSHFSVIDGLRYNMV